MKGYGEFVSFHQMVGYYRRRVSRSAVWCQRLAVLALPYFALAIWLHRGEHITSPQAFWLIAFGIMILLAALACGVRGLANLWNSGDLGGKAATRGILLALIMLAPFLWYAFLAWRYPAFSDVATNPYSPPQFIAATKLREDLRNSGINQLVEYDEAYAEALRAAWPQLASRRYNAGAERIFGAAQSLIRDRGWRISSAQFETPPDPAEPEALSQLAPASGGRVQLADAARGFSAPASRIEAYAFSPVFGFRTDIIVAIIPEAETTLVDMRAASRWGSHDFGRNAELISGFLEDLDEALVGIGGEG